MDINTLSKRDDQNNRGKDVEKKLGRILYHLFRDVSLVAMIKQGRMKWTGHVWRMGED